MPRSAIMGFSEDRAQGKFGPCYLLVAENPYVLWDAVESWKSTWKQSSGDPALPVRSFSGAQIDLDRLLDAGATLPMFETLQLVLIQNLEKIPSVKQSSLITFLKSASSSTRILMTAESMDKRTSLFKFISDKIEVEAFKTVYPEDVPGWVRRIAAEFEWSISPQAVELAASVHGTDLFAVRQTIERATLFISRKRRIESADLEVVLVGAGEHDVHQLLEAGSRGDLVAALTIARSLWASADNDYALSIWLGSIYSQCLRLYQFLDMAGQSDAEIGRALHMHSFLVGKSRPIASAYGYDGLTRTINAIFETDWAIKTSTLTPNMAWEMFAWRISGGSSRLARTFFDLESPRVRE